MIKFFRKIRHQLITENKFSKYALYAIGEIVLVIIGILIALPINTCNENRKNKILENEYLEGIKTDLKSDVSYINILLPKYKSRIQKYTSLDSLVKAKSDKLFEIDISEIQNLTFQMATLYLRKGSYSSLISQNSAGLIENKDLLIRIEGAV